MQGWVHRLQTANWDAIPPHGGRTRFRSCRRPGLQERQRWLYWRRLLGAAGCLPAFPFQYTHLPLPAFHKRSSSTKQQKVPQCIQCCSDGVRLGGIAGAFMLYMLFIIGQLAWESKAGKLGTFVLFIGLGFGMVGFAAKVIMQWVMEK